MVDVVEHQTESRPELIGAYLASIREKKVLPIEMAARDTRIRVQRLQEIENDDFSQFAHPSYARMFLMDYARYLGVPISAIRELLPDRGECGTQGYQYLQRISGTEDYTPLRARRPRRSFMPLFAGVIVLLIAMIGGFKLWITYRNLDRIGFGRANEQPLAALPVAEPVKEEAVLVPEPAAPAEPVPASSSEEARLIPSLNPILEAPVENFSLTPRENSDPAPALSPETLPADSLPAQPSASFFDTPQIYAGSLIEQPTTGAVH